MTADEAALDALTVMLRAHATGHPDGPSIPSPVLAFLESGVASVEVIPQVDRWGVAQTEPRIVVVMNGAGQLATLTVTGGTGWGIQPHGALPAAAAPPASPRAAS